MKVKVSTSVGGFGDKIKNTWGLEPWQGVYDKDKDILFFGLYHDFDWNVYHHLGPEYKRTIFWCGSDILRLIEMPDRQRIIKLFPVDHYCETEVEAENLRKMGIDPIVAPSFLEDPATFPITFKPTDKPHIWLCAHPGREEEYGVLTARKMADIFPLYTFHIYGITGENFPTDELDGALHNNFIFHGVVPNEQFNQEIRQYHCGLRTNEHDGMSEVPIKSALLGQYPISKLPYEKVWNYETEDELVKLLEKLPTMKESNNRKMKLRKHKEHGN